MAGETTLPEVTIEGQAPHPPQAEVRAVPLENGDAALVGSDGEIKAVPAANVAKAIELGYRPASEAEVYREQTGTPGAIMAGVTGFGRGLSFGVTDPLTIAAERALHGDKGAEEMRRTLSLLKEGHETASFVGEIAGSLAPLALGIGGGGGAAVSGESALARAGSRALGAMPRAGLEGMAIGAGEQLTEDVLGNHDLVAQKYLSASLKGGLFGAILGAGLHAGGGAIMDKLATKGASAIERAEGGVYRSLAERAEAAASKPAASRLAEFAEEQAAKGAMHSATLNAADLMKLGKTAEEQAARMRKVGRTLIDEGVTTAFASKKTQAERITSRLAEVGEELGSVRKSFDKAAVRPSADTVMKSIENDVVKPLLERPFSAADQAVVQPYAQELERRLGGKTVFKSFEDLHELRLGLDKRLNQMKVWEKFYGEAPGHKELKAIRGILEDEYERAAEIAAAELGESTASKYRLQKSLYSDLKTAEKWATKAAARETQNRAISLTDTIMAGSALASGQPLGLLAPVANKLARTYGNQVAATLADKATRLGAVQRAAAAWDSRVQGAVESFFKGGTKPSAKAAGKASGASPTVDAKTARALRTAVQDPAALTERVSQVVGATGLRASAPRVAQAMSGTIMRAAAYLQTNLPKEPPPAGFAFGPTKPRALGPRAQAKLEAVVGAIDMDGMIADLERGRVDRQKIEALKFINPDAYADIVTAMTRYGIENQAQLTHQQEVALSIMTGQPIGAIMQPKTIRGFQQAHASQGPVPDPRTGAVETKPIGDAGPRGMSRAANALRSSTDRMEADNG